MTSISEDEVSYQRGLRGHLRTKITKKLTSVSSEISDYSVQECKDALTEVETLEEKLNKFNEAISRGIWSNKASQDVKDLELENCDKYEERLYKITKLLKSRIAALTETTSSSRHSKDFVRVSNQLKLPQLPLPTYNHEKGESLERFFENFEAIIDKYELSGFEKFIFLEKQLSGAPLILIKSLQGTQQSYAEAKSLLTAAFAKKLVQKYDIIRRLTELKLTLKDDPYSFISEMRVILQTFDTLKIDVNTILQYFIWDGMNDLFQRQLISITNCNKPSLEQIQDNIFEATDRYLMVSNTSRKAAEYVAPSRESVKCMAAVVSHSRSPKRGFSVQSKFKPCCLCSDGEMVANHPIFKCEQYDSASKKVDKLKSLKFCTKCGNSHNAASCKFRFSRPCRHCNRSHFSFLCINNQSGGTGNSKQRSDNANVNCNSAVISFNMFHSDGEHCTILPTFSCTLSSGKKLRSLKDSGCQCNFIRSDIADRDGLKVIRAVSITIHGFNSSKTYETNEVEAVISFGDSVFTVTAICVPEISVKMTNSGIHKVANAFVQKGYKLADSFLLDFAPPEIEFILGSNSAYCVPETTVVFGSVKPSSYSETPFGIMLMGSISDYNKNYVSIPSIHSGVSSVTTESQFSDTPTLSDVIDDEAMTVDAQARCATKQSLVEMSSPVLDSSGNVIEAELEKVINEALHQNYNIPTEVASEDILSCEKTKFNESSDELNDAVIDVTLANIKRDYDGRLIVPLIWNPKTYHFLGRNFFLSKQILFSNKRRLDKTPGHLLMVDEVIREQEKVGVIERIEDLSKFLADKPDCSFLAHMAVFRLNRDTTKVRVVYLSNLNERDPRKPITFSHNQAILPGPSLNKKISTSILQLRFDKFLLTFDLVKAFLQLKLNESDADKLCFLWFRNVRKEDFEVIGFRSTRVMFGLRCSPALLMLSLYYMLVLTEFSDEREQMIARTIYHLSYMDNCAYTSNDDGEMSIAVKFAMEIFNKFKFELQQFESNCRSLKDDLPDGIELSYSEKSKLLGMLWNKSTDELSTPSIRLDETATTKREILSSIAQNYDIFNLCGPLLNRARLFMHGLQNQSDVGWDTKLNSGSLRQWKNICVQANASPEMPIARSVGKRTDKYRLVAFTDSSKVMFGAVIYIYNLESGELSFLLSKNRLVNKQLESKSIPALELQGVCLGVETLIDTYKELSGQSCVQPLSIVELLLFTDSLVCISWLDSYVNKIDKMIDKSIFVRNRLLKICQMCETHPVKFGFCEGTENPADYVTRPCSYRQLSRSNYHTGPDMVTLLNPHREMPRIVIPNPVIENSFSPDLVDVSAKHASVGGPVESLVSVDRVSSFVRLVSITNLVLKFINVLKLKLRDRYPVKFSSLRSHSDKELWNHSYEHVILCDQQKHFPKVIEYFSKNSRGISDMPDLVAKLNLFMSKDGIIRVKSKFRSWNNSTVHFPILLSSSSRIASYIIMDMHKKLNHSGTYSVLSELRKRFWIMKVFSVVKRTLKSCVLCRRFNNATIKLNQSPYRDFRCDPPNIPFRSVFLDYCGPFTVKFNSKNIKVYLLCITCIWSRAVNIKLCRNLSEREFLRAFQTHSFEYGIAEIVYSDSGSQIVAGGNTIMNFIRDVETQSYFLKSGVKSLEFKQYPKGCHQLGGLIENIVKQVKKLVYSAIKNAILDYFDFEFLVLETIHLINRRPVAFKNSLRDCATDGSVPVPITPEMLLKGYELVSLNLVPDLQPTRMDEDLWSDDSDIVSLIRSSYGKLCKARLYLTEKYGEEFLSQLAYQATDKKDRYRAVTHQTLKIGDIVLLKEEFTKAINYPMAVVREITLNDLDEVTEIIVQKETHVNE